MRKRQKSFVVVEGDDEQEPDSENLFACIQQSNDSNQQTDQSNREIRTSSNQEQITNTSRNVFDLVPWTEEELKRDTLPKETRTQKNTSKI